jgi:2-succinyl-5-enolpyruvyl-6-hydroxy-3-cyclohexene-1-carboxylate synthase
VLAEPSSNARRGPNALSAYQYLLGTPEFVSGHRPGVIVTAGKPGLSRQQVAFLRESTAAGAEHVVMADGSGRWADPARTASAVMPAAVWTGSGSAGAPAVTKWLMSWLTADAVARAAVDAILDEEELSEPRLARDLAAALPDGALLWAASSLPIRDLDQQMPPRDGLRVLANRGASGIDGLVSASAGAALAHQRSGGGPAAALLGDLALLHDLSGLILGPGEPRPDLAIVVVNNDGGGIFSLLEQAAFPASFERLFGTPHGLDLGAVAEAVRLPYHRLERAADLRPVLAACAPRGSGPQLIEARTSREAGTRLRHRLREAAAAAVRDARSRPGHVSSPGHPRPAQPG